jgi:hypothetical protein
MINESKTIILVFLGLTLATVATILVLLMSTSDDPRKILARNVVDNLAGNNWDLSALKLFLCEDRPKDGADKSATSFDLYQDYGGIKAVGKIKLVPMASPNAMAMDTFIPVLFNKQFAPFPSMPSRSEYYATYIQLQTQKSAKGKFCVAGWGRNEIPVSPEQTEDFLSYQGIFRHD